MPDLRVLIVTDPMCSWCWGMSSAVEEAAVELRDEVEFDFLLGGINTHGTQPLGEFGERHLLQIWREVRSTTGQDFGFRLPEQFVYNSTLPCLAVEAVRRFMQRPPFGYLHRLQQCLFVQGRNINDRLLLGQVALEFGLRRSEFDASLEDQELRDIVSAQFVSSRVYGTNALPSVLVENSAERRLLLGGYADAAMLVAQIRARLALSA
ncbi:MAG: DsbA family protein [Gammaproteobacteria bacterium]|nr:DsbA family protein [Gammaproteobacteria bacterium]